MSSAGDLLVGAPFTNPNGRYSGTTYVVFGHQTPFGPTLDLSTLNGTNGFKIQGEAAGDGASVSLGRAGDVNGDGLDDIIIGANGADATGTNAGAAYVVFGKAAFGPVLNLSSLNGTAGFKIQAENANDKAGVSASGAGDINGDGFDDVVIGATGVTGSEGYADGAAYVVLGHGGTFSAQLNLSTLDASTGYRLSGFDSDGAGSKVSAAGDVNGDGLADFLVGANRYPATRGAGATFLIYGNATVPGAPLDLHALTPSQGLLITTSHAYADAAEVGSGDINGDGFSDVLIGARGVGPNGAGAGYVVFGGPNLGSLTIAKLRKPRPSPTRTATS